MDTHIAASSTANGGVTHYFMRIDYFIPSQYSDDSLTLTFELAGFSAVY